MTKNIVIINGHPDTDRRHYAYALADAYAAGAASAGHQISRIEVSALEFDLLRSPRTWMEGAPDSLRPAQEAVAVADHLVFVFPLWMGTMPAMMHAFLERFTSGGFAVEPVDGGKNWMQKLNGKSARVIVTMGMPAPAYRLLQGAHSLKSFERSILKFAGVGPIRDTLIGQVEARSETSRQRVLERIEKLGAAAR